MDERDGGREEGREGVLKEGGKTKREREKERGVNLHHPCVHRMCVHIKQAAIQDLYIRRRGGRVYTV